MNKGDIWRVCAFQDSKLWATAAWTIRTRSAWSRLTQCLSPNVRQTCLGISIRAAASWNLKVWTELRSSPMIDCSSLHLRYSHVQATRMSVWSILLGHGVTVSCGCVSQWSAWTVGHDMTVSTLRVGGLSIFRKETEEFAFISNLLCPFQIIGDSKNFGESNHLNVWLKL